MTCDAILESSVHRAIFGGFGVVEIHHRFCDAVLKELCKSCGDFEDIVKLLASFGFVDLHIGAFECASD